MTAALLVDLDGVLVDSLAAVDRAWRWWAGRHLAGADLVVPDLAAYLRLS